MTQLNFHRLDYLKLFILSLLIFVTVIAIQTIIPPKASAEYNSGRIIDNGVFLDAQSMSAAAIQAFLVGKGAGLANMTFMMDCDIAGTQAKQVYVSLGAPCGYQAPASHIIYYTSQVYGVSPKVILTTMQKEQSLTTATNPTSWQINQAMGYACPTSGSCEDGSNFFYQIDNGTWVMRFHYERARGNMDWWYTSSSWTCGTGKPNYYMPNLYPGQNVNFVDPYSGAQYATIYMQNAATSAFYCYTPHTFNNHTNSPHPQELKGTSRCYPSLPAMGSVGRCYTGSYNFVKFFELWFGTTQTPGVFKIEGSSTVYTAINGYRVAIPAMYTLQDFGYTPESIATITQSTGNLLPSPPISSGISQTLGHIIKSTSDTDSDGGNVYFVSVGVAYPLKDMAQFINYGFDQQTLTYVPLTYIQSMRLGQVLKDFIKTPDDSVFSISNRQKHVIFSNSTHLTANPGGVVSLVSAGTASLLTTGNPYSDNAAVFLKKSNSAAVFVYNNNTYYSVSADSYGCWGVGVLNDRPLRNLPPEFLPSSITPSGQLSCIYKDSLGTPQLLTGLKKASLSPYSIGVSSQTPPAELSSLFNSTTQSANPLSKVVKSDGNNTVWYLEGGLRRAIPSMSNFGLLGGSSQLEIISTGSVNAITQGSIKLGDGQAVKTPDNSSVFVINNNKRYSVTTPDLFNSLQLSWNNIETYSKSDLDTTYPLSSDSILPYLYVAATNRTYLLDSNGCYYLPASILTEYGQSQASISSSQPYNSSIAPYINACNNGSQFIKSTTSGTVYKLVLGVKKPISSWSKMLELNGGVVPYITILSPGIVDGFVSGSTY